MIIKAAIFECDMAGCDSTVTLRQSRDESVARDGSDFGWIEVGGPVESPFTTPRRCICPKHGVLK